MLEASHGPQEHCSLPQPSPQIPQATTSPDGTGDVGAGEEGAYYKKFLLEAGTGQEGTTAREDQRHVSLLEKTPQNHLPCRGFSEALVVP